ncbi:unnamed protein product [Rhizophagus irregularis]|uniref:Uncharacterized protein n=1 Tax=Rhizophagus irregularis TaxID=588596 RepID=A0A916E9I1_9GLOM|nr:unnamed protein product [Rhizophagus irregularis]CAB5370365.1 unnamed protein product [Rhizophagus irregularis]
MHITLYKFHTTIIPAEGYSINAITLRVTYPAYQNQNQLFITKIGGFGRTKYFSLCKMKTKIYSMPFNWVEM